MFSHAEIVSQYISISGSNLHKMANHLRLLNVAVLNPLYKDPKLIVLYQDGDRPDRNHSGATYPSIWFGFRRNEHNLKPIAQYQLGSIQQ